MFNIGDKIKIHEDYVNDMWYSNEVFEIIDININTKNYVINNKLKGFSNKIHFDYVRGLTSVESRKYKLEKIEKLQNETEINKYRNNKWTIF